MMTPALRAMVEAMGAELERQSWEDFGWVVYDPEEDVGELIVGIDGARLDLEKAARTGLRAIPLEDMARAIRAAQLVDIGYGGSTHDAKMELFARLEASWSDSVPQAQAVLDAILGVDSLWSENVAYAQAALDATLKD